MKERIKLALRKLSSALRLAARRIMLRWLRKLVDLADDRLHAAEVKFRDERTDHAGASGANHAPQVGSTPAVRSRETSVAGRIETWSQWEMRRSGVAPISKKAARRRREHLTASAFDLRFAR